MSAEIEIKSLKEEIEKDPSSVKAWANLAKIYSEAEEPEKTIECLEKIVELVPDSAPAYNNIANNLRRIGNFEDSLIAIEKAVAIDPDSAPIQNNYGTILKTLGKTDEAISAFEKAVELEPNNPGTNGNLGQTLIWKNENDRAIEYLRKSANMEHNNGQPLSYNDVYPHRIKHDFEQIDYLSQKGLLDKKYNDYKDALEEAHELLKGNLGEQSSINLDAKLMQRISPSFNQIINFSEDRILEQGAINQDLDVKVIEEEYNGSFPEMLHIDNLLTDEALQAMRNFCLESTIWKRNYAHGYLGATLNGGFSSKLILQIAEELRTTFPRIFGDHLLNQAWGFKYDSQMKGINVHADFAAVNVNFWISPDEGNLDPEKGGLVVWDKESPQDWNFKDYNTSHEKIDKFIEESSAKPVRVPHKQNRAMIFNSTLFHKTDDFHFKDNYENRRINITFLYGRGLRVR